MNSLPLLIIACAIGVCYSLFFFKKATAGYTPKAQTFVEINGESYGVFKDIRNVNDLFEANDSQPNKRHIVTMRRNFVTGRSLAHWAQRVFSSHVGQTDIYLKIRTGNGQKIADVVLKNAKPILFRIETASAMRDGEGFLEEVHLAAPVIDIY